MMTTSEETYLEPETYLNSDHPLVVEFAHAQTKGVTDDTERVIKLYYAVRDGIIYTPYWDFEDAETFRASNCLVTGHGMCQSKSALLAAAARVLGIPARIGFADVINHMSSKKFTDLIGTDVLRWHSYTDIYLDGKWVKATPAFDTELCRKFSVAPLDFDGTQDSLFQSLNSGERKFMEYIGDHGTYADIPVDKIRADFQEHYGDHLASADLTGLSFRDEVEAERADRDPGKKSAG